MTPLELVRLEADKAESRTADYYRAQLGEPFSRALDAVGASPAVHPEDALLLVMQAGILAEVLARTLDKLAAAETRLAELAPQVPLGK